MQLHHQEEIVVARAVEVGLDAAVVSCADRV